MEPSPSVLSYRRAASAERADECYRCGYPLLGITDDQACPECGLLARRSRRPTDELHNSRPRWLGRISRGAKLILLAILIAVAWPFATAWILSIYYLTVFTTRYGFTAFVLGHAVAAVLSAVGTWLLTSPEGYPPADRADARLRTLLRAWAILPIIAIVIQTIRLAAIYQVAFVPLYYSASWEPLSIATFALFTVGLAPLPLLLFRQLGGLARRARSAHLAEHCTIVGVGTSSALLFVVVCAFILHNAERWGWGTNWSGNSKGSLLLMLALAVAAFLFAGWSVYLFVRFALAFRRAARELHENWTADDRAVSG